MWSIDEIYSNARTKQQEASDLRTRAGKLDREAYAIQQALQGRILAGETTGDRIRDLALALLIGEAGEAPYRHLDSSLRGHAGEFTLVEYWERVTVRHVMFPSPGHENVYDWKQRFRCGVLNADELAISLAKPPTWDLPIARYVELDHSGLVKREGPFSLGFLRNMLLPLLPLVELPLGVDEHHVMRVYIGDNSVRAYLQRHFHDEGDELFGKCAELLGKLVLTAEEDAPPPTVPVAASA